MLQQRINEQIFLCYERAELASRAAQASDDRDIARDYRKLEAGWFDLAEKLRFARQVSGFIEWRARRLNPPPDFEWREGWQ